MALQDPGAADAAPPGQRPWALGLAVAAAVAAGGLVLLPATRRSLGPWAATCAWGLVVSASFAGWGRRLGRWLTPRRPPPDLGLAAAWGFAASAVAGGVLCFVGLAKRPTLVAWVLLGLAWMALELPRRRPRLGRPSAWVWGLAVLALFAVAAVEYGGAAGNGNPNPSDDWIAYIPYTRMMLDSGSFIDPFGLRRMAAYGGHTFLQAIMMIVAEPLQIHVLDQGVCTLLVLGLVLGFPRATPGTSRVAVALVALMWLMLPEIRINSASEVSGVVALLGLYRTTAWLDDGSRGRGGTALVALMAAAACTLRQNYISTAVVFVAAAFLMDGAPAPSPGGRALPARLREGLVCGGLVVAFMLPWAGLAYRSNRSFLFPLFHGNYDPQFALLSAHATATDRLKLLSSTLLGGSPVHDIQVFLVAALFLPLGHGRRPHLALWAAALVGCASLVWSLPDAEELSLLRYNYAAVAAFTLAAALAASRALGRAARGGSWSVVNVAAFAILVAMVLQVSETRPALAQRLTVALDRIAGSRAAPGPLEVPDPTYARMQQTVPAGQALLVMVERPYLLDYDRNPIRSVDMPGGVSPPPGLPYFRGGAAVGDYLLANGIRYFAFTDPNRAETDLYRRGHWEHELTAGTPLWRGTAPVYLALFDDAMDLGARHKHLYDDGHHIVVDLAAPP